VEHPAELKLLKQCLKHLPGKKILTIEETTTAQWLYVELKDYANKILICEPYHNSLLKSGPKNDKIDTVKLCTLLRNGSLKEVFHTTDELYHHKIRCNYLLTFVASCIVIHQALFASMS